MVGTSDLLIRIWLKTACMSHYYLVITDQLTHVSYADEVQMFRLLDVIELEDHIHIFLFDL